MICYRTSIFPRFWHGTGCPLCQECQECQETSGIGQNVRKLSGEIMFFRKMSGLSGNCEFFSKYQNSLFVFYEFEGKRSLLLICNICSSGTSRNAFSKNLRLRRAVCVFVCEEVCCDRVSNQPWKPWNWDMWPQKPWKPWEQPFFLSYDPEIIPHSGAFWSSKTQNFLQPWWKCSQIIIGNHSFWSILEQ